KVGPLSFQLVRHAHGTGELPDLAPLNTAFARLTEVLAEARARSGSSGPFFLGEQFSLADVALAPFFARLHITLQEKQVWDIQAYPQVAAWSEALRNRESVKASWPGDEVIQEVQRRQAHR
ncbi:hypothetical protein BZG36_05590, partial [Bifiguratus adelaidae]